MVTYETTFAHVECIALAINMVMTVLASWHSRVMGAHTLQNNSHIRPQPIHSKRLVVCVNTEHKMFCVAVCFDCKAALDDK